MTTIITTAASVVSADSTKAPSLSRRVAHLRISARKNARVSGLRVTVEGVRAAVKHTVGNHWTATVDLRGLPRGCYVVRVSARVNGDRVVRKHMYRVVYGNPKASAAAGATPGIMIGWYEDLADDGTVVAHIGFDVTNQEVPPGDDVKVYDLPVIDVASALHRGGMEGIEPVYLGLVQWIEDSGYRRAGAGRELYLEWNDEDPSACVTEAPDADREVKM